MASDPPKKPEHRLTDHLHGLDSDHSHEDGVLDHDHDHDHFGTDDDIQSNTIWIQDNLALLSVGIDIGSSCTQVVFSRVHLRRFGQALTSRYLVVGRETLYESPVTLTPYQSDERIDEKALGNIIDQAYDGAGIHPDSIDTGAVILTGEALRRENARAIAEVIAEIGGEFVCATAGHHMEAMLAAYGSGAAKASHDLGKRLLNIDIGGGTTKFALIEDGKVLKTAAIHIGGRLLVVDDRQVITRLDPAGGYIAEQAGFQWRLGAIAAPHEIERVADWMAEALFIALVQNPVPANIADLYLTEPLGAFGGIDGVMVSGGVGEYVYRREERDFGDLGKHLGHALRARWDNGRLGSPLLPAGQCIRATAIGASEYSVQISGNTVYVSDPRALLPRKNLQVLQPKYSFADRIDPVALSHAIIDHFKAFDLTEGEHEVALAFRWRGEPSFERISNFSKGIVTALRNTLERGNPVFIILDGDIAQILGSLLKEELKVNSEILVIDGISLWDFDFIDLGRIRLPSFTVPVTIKSLVFNEDPRMPHVHGPTHHHHPPHQAKSG